MRFKVADDKFEEFLKEKADKEKVKQIYEVAERFEKHCKPQTNADRIRAMSDEELAEFLTEYEICTNCKYLASKCEFDGICTKGFASAMAYEWLKSEVKE